MAAPLMNEVARDYVTDGVPSSGAHEIRKPDLRAWGAWVEQTITTFTSNGGFIYTSKAEIDADLSKDPNTLAWVYGDGTVANNGLYMKIGAIGTGSWSRVGDLPYSFVVASNVGAGTSSAIQATTTIPVSGSALVLLNIFEENTGSPVTVSFNGETALTVKSNSGNDILPGGLQSGMLVMGRISGSTFRIVSDQVSSAIVADAEASASLAQKWAEGTLPGGAGTKSAKEYALDAAGFAGYLVPETVTASTYVPTIGDANDKLKRLSNASGVALTIPINASVAFTIGTVLTFEQLGAGQITVSGSGGVTIRKPENVNAKSAGQYSVFQVVKIATDEWILFGALETTQSGYMLGSVQVFTSSGTWTRPSGCAAVRVRVVGGGGGGGGVTGASSQAADGGGGGAGGFAEKWVISGLSDTVAVTVGAGGAGGVAGSNGTAGGNSHFGGYATAEGGLGGATMTAGTSATSVAGGAGGNGVSGDHNVRGGTGHRGLRFSGSAGVSGAGGDSHEGRGGGPNVNNVGENATGYGGGGGGGASIGVSRVGGDGSPGVVIVEEYY